MPASTRLRFLLNRARNINVSSVTDRARQAARTHGRSTASVVCDMLWQAGFHGVGFQDYVDYDFAILNRRERATYMTSPFSHQLAQKFDDPAFRHLFHDKAKFNAVFDSFLGREWMTAEPGNADKLEAFGRRKGVLITKEPMGRAGHGVHRYTASRVGDWAGFHRGLLERGETLIEENITQHRDLAAFCAGTVNTTRVTAFFDGHTVHILSMAQKFGRGEVSDQNLAGGFYVMLDERGHAVGAGYDSRGNIYSHHPESGLRVADFQLPMFDEVVAFIDKVARVVPGIRYVGWDIALTPAGPVLVEGNWAAGVYENKPTASGVRTGTKARFLEVVGRP